MRKRLHPKQNKNKGSKVLRNTAIVPRCHPLFVRPVPYYLPGKASLKLLG